MHVMSSVTPANDNQSFQESGGATAKIMSPSPPAPPPPSCGPPPPPPPPGLGAPAGGHSRQRRIRSFFWKPIPEEKVKGGTNVWTQSPGQQQQYQIDVRTIEELFSQTDCQSPRVAMVTRGGKARSSLKETKDRVRILNSKTEMNVGIFLKHFKKSNQEIIQDIRHGNSKPYGAALLQDLLKLLPETEEAKKLQAFKGDVSKLSLVDSFMFLLTQVPSFEVRINAMALKEVFPPAFENTSRDIDILQMATKEVLGCEELHAVLHLVLQAGNILNAGGYAGNAVGFKLSSLLTLADTKANKPDMNLLHFVAMEAQKKDEKLLDFPGKLEHVQSASRISLEILDAELHSLSSRTSSVEESIQGDSELLEQLDQFLQSSTTALVELRRRRQDLTKEGNMLIDFFCEDKESFKLDECFRVFQDFCLKFQKAVKDNREREQHRNRLRQLEEKRHPWTGGEVSGSESDPGRLHPVKSRPHSPQNALGRSGSIRRSRGSASAAADRQLTNLLTLGLTSDLQPWRRLWREAEPPETSPTGSPETLRSPKGSPLARLQPQAPEEHTPPPKRHTQAGTGAPITAGREPDRQPQPDLNSNTSNLNHSPQPKPVDNRPDNDLNHSPQPKPVDNRPDNDLNHSPQPKPVDNRPDNDLNHSPQPKPVDNRPDNDLNHSPQPKPVDNRPGNDLHHNQPSGLNVYVERRALVTGLRAFDQVSTSHRHRRLDNQVVTDLDTGYEELSPVCESREERAEKEKEEEKDEESQEEKEKEEEERAEEEKEKKEGEESQKVKDVFLCQTEKEACDPKPTKSPAPTDGPAPPQNTLYDEGEGPTHAAEPPADSTPSESQPTNEHSVPASASTNQPEAVSPSTNGSPAWSAQGTNPKASPVSKTSRLQAPRMGLTGGRKQVIRTLTTLENQDMRRVVPISKSSRHSLIPGKRVGKPPGHQSSDPGTPSSSSSSTSNPSNPSLRPLERSAIASQGSTRHTEDGKDPKAPAGVRSSARHQLSVLRRNPSSQTPARPAAPRPPPEEKMCRATLRALAAARGAVPAAGGGGNSLSTPSPPSPRAGSSKHSLNLPSFARNTAASTFRWTPSSLNSPRSSPGTLTPAKTSPCSSPVPSLSPGPSPLTRTASLRHPRVTTPVPPGRDSTLRRSQSIRGPSRSPRTPLPNPLATRPPLEVLTVPKGNARRNSGSSDKSTNSRDSSKAQKPTWR
uniref:FH2 domain-containing protein n=2 Tax=Esox lucius TaxID=8010 RepID=A0A3P8XQI9_ESOLU